MILQSLTNYYAKLLQKGKIPPFGWSMLSVSYALEIDENGRLIDIIELSAENQKDVKKRKGQLFSLPDRKNRTSGIAANFLSDKSAYILGLEVDKNGNKTNTEKKFKACADLHKKILGTVNSPAARALLNFFNNWDCKNEINNGKIREHQDILKQGNIIFYFEGKYIHDDSEIRKAWDDDFNADKTTNDPDMVCLITGEKGPIEMTHPVISGVKGSQSSGAALVSFNANADCSYGKTQNANGPVSKRAAVAYTSALNYLLKQAKSKIYVGDSTVVFWAEEAEESYQDFFYSFYSCFFNEQDIAKMIRDLFEGKAVYFNENQLDPNMKFYILGLSPANARLSVRFFLQNSFGNFLKNIQEHYERISIVRPANDKRENLSVVQLLKETINKKSKDQTPTPNMASDVLKAILTGAPYPATLLNGVNLRIKAENKITRGRAAIIKAYYLKKPHKDIPKEVLVMALNSESTSVPYNLGRLFALLEYIQKKAIANLNTTITDKYFSSASATPSRVFPTLVNLAQKHLRKIDKNIYYKQQLTEIMSKLGERYPVHLSLPEQGAFQLGYYHQTQEFYKKKEGK